jgi:putative DNA primase/helicase
MNCDFKGAVGKVEQIAPSAYRAPSPKKTNNIEKMRRIWDGSSPVVDGDPVSHYLQARDVWYPPISQQLRYARLPYWQDQQILDTYDCMVARVCDHEGNGVSLHVTYLYHSKKANVASPKKVIAATGSSPRIELFPCEDRLALAEGIETALAVAGSYTTLPAWSTISAGGMEKFECPVRVKYVDIFGDNDANFIGQLASYRLAHRLRASGKEVRVFIPADIGKDWADG